MGIIDKLFPKKDDKHDHAHGHGHAHVHMDCPKCGKHFHTQSEYDAHVKNAHPK